MRIITIHADFIEFKAEKKALKSAPEVDTSEQRAEECLVVLTAFEKPDETNVKEITKKYISNIIDIAHQVKAKTIVLYPYAHLSSNLGKPKDAQKVLEDAEQILKNEFIVVRAPFGWYKSFNLKCKGHPMSELSREFSAEEASLKREYKDTEFTFDKTEPSNQKKLLLSTAYALGLAAKRAFPNAEIGEAGFYQDTAYIDIAGPKIKNDDFKQLGTHLKKIVKEDITFEKTGAELNKYQQDIKNDTQNEETYKLGDIAFTPLFKSPILESTIKIKAFKIVNIGSAYWKHNENNEQLTRLYIVAFPDKEELEQYVKKQEKAEARSHLKIGRDQELFVLSDLVGPGLPLLTPKGTIIKNEIVNFLWELHKGKGYQQVTIPHIAKEELYKKSGHWDKFGDELFKVKGKSDNFILKPMNCPHHMIIFDSFSLSYRDMPVRFFEPTTVYRDEKSGQLTGLSRVRAITQDDGHLFLRTSQIKEEVRAIVEIIMDFYTTVGIDKDYWVSLSVRGDDMSKYLGDEKIWDVAEESLEETANALNLKYKKIKGEAAFYGPKLDFMFKDALGREWQLATIQLDFNLPERFNLSYVNEKGVKERPVVIHRAISGSLERFLSIIIEHFAGKFPMWLSPEQVRIVTVTDRSNNMAHDIHKKMEEKGIRSSVDDRNETIGKKVRESQLAHVNYTVTIGDKELEKGNLAVRSRDGEVKFDVKIEDFISQLVQEIDSRE